MTTLALVVPGAASVASPPLVVGGMLVGLVLLGGFAFMLARTFKTMSAARPEDRVELAIYEANDLSQSFEHIPSEATLAALVDGLRQSETNEEADAYSSTLSKITGRYFRGDVVAWDVWMRRDGHAFVQAQLDGRTAAPRRTALPLSS